jgi:hypothetical protein
MTLWVFLVFPIHYPAPSFVGTPWLWLVKSTSYQMSEPFYGKFPTWIAFKSSEIPSTPTKSSWFNQPDQWWKRQHTFKQELTTGFQSRLSNPLLRRLVTWTCTRTPARRTESWSSHEQLRVLCSKPTWLKIYKKIHLAASTKSLRAHLAVHVQPLKASVFFRRLRRVVIALRSWNTRPTTHVCCMLSRFVRENALDSQFYGNFNGEKDHW